MCIDTITDSSDVAYFWFFPKSTEMNRYTNLPSRETSNMLVHKIYRDVL